MGMSKNEFNFKNFTIKYNIEIMDDEFKILKINKKDFNKEVLKKQIKNIVCKGYVKNDLLYYVETEYQEDEYSPGTPMILTIYTEQEYTDYRFLKDLDKFVDRIIEIYNSKRKPNIDDMLGIEATYVVDFPKLDFSDDITYYVFLSIEYITEKDDFVYVVLGLW
jgi:hypothetical protein